MEEKALFILQVRLTASIFLLQMIRLNIVVSIYVGLNIQMNKLLSSLTSLINIFVNSSSFVFALNFYVSCTLRGQKYYKASEANRWRMTLMNCIVN